MGLKGQNVKPYLKICIEVGFNMVHNETMNFQEWIQKLPGSPNPTNVSQQANLPKATILRHFENGQTTAEKVIIIARAYKVSPIDALIDMGFLNPDDLGGERTPIKQALAAADISELLEGLVNKLNESGLVEGKFTVADITGSAFDDLKSRRKKRSKDEVDHAVIIAGINAGTEDYAAHEATDPLEEHFT